MRIGHWLRGAVLAAALLALAGQAGAQVSAECGPRKPADADGTPAASGKDSFWTRERLTGDWGGARTRLEDAGIFLGLSEQSEIWGNLRGGIRRGAVYAGLTSMGLTFNPGRAADPGKAFPWSGFCFYVSAYQIHGRGPTPNLVGALQAVSSIEATRATRLFDLWAEQRLFDDAFSIRLGQGGANTEFMLSDQAALFVNSSFGFPVMTALALPSGGPNYPLATPFLRLKWQPTEAFTLLGAVFNGDPAGRGFNDPQRRNASGTLFRLRDHAFFIAEAQLALAIPTARGDAAGSYKLGVWVHNGYFADQALDAAGRSLADPRSSGVPRQLRGNYAVYGVMDQMLLPVRGSKDQGLAAFASIAGGPGDRNLLHLSFIAGLTYKGLLHPEGADKAGFGVAYAGIGAAARQGSRATVFFGGTGQPFRPGEAALEWTYQYPLTPWWQVQPSLQYVISPGATPGARQLPNAATLGLRTSLLF